MSDRDWQNADTTDRTEQIMSVEEEALPGLLEEKRVREELSRRIAFGEGL